MICLPLDWSVRVHTCAVYIRATNWSSLFSILSLSLRGGYRIFPRVGARIRRLRQKICEFARIFLPPWPPLKKNSISPRPLFISPSVYLSSSASCYFPCLEEPWFFFHLKTSRILNIKLASFLADKGSTLPFNLADASVNYASLFLTCSQ